ncbi:FCD domain-containing protein [Szabonella alba]|uniref:GntR family transcriptional regulator n=1 Tax=Szabonella alba TaxID=2804194 RepID=A0A8K0VCG0_9RHOB|nr:GntR family transcriptional regulator [Szabonella alba]
MEPTSALGGPIAREPTLGDQAHDRLCALLMAGQVAPGDRLSLRDLAARLGISVMPVREAVARLAASGALDVSAKRAASVPLMGLARFRDITKVRIEVEGFAAAEAARNRSTDDLQRIGAAEAAFRALRDDRSGDMARAVQINQEFHFAVYAAAGSPTLTELITPLWLRVGPVLNLDLRASPERLQKGQAVACHAAALAAIRAGDAEGARAAIARDIASAAEFIIARGCLAP